MNMSQIKREGYPRDIIEVLRNCGHRFRLNEYDLYDIVSKAHKCHNFVLISIIGAKNSGKTLFFNQLLSYLESDDRNNWPKDEIIEWFSGFVRGRQLKSQSVLRMWSEPFIFEEKGQRTAVFLMDTLNVFKDKSNIDFNGLVEEIVGLFLTTSSIVIYLKEKQFLTSEIEDLESIVDKSIKLIETMDSFRRLFCVINGWDSSLREEFKKYSFGSKDGINYLNEQFSGHNLGQYFDGIECCLLPSSGTNSMDEDFKFNEMSTDLSTELSNLFKTKILNFNEMKRKTYPNSNKLMKPMDLLPLFKSYINRLNGVSVPIDFGFVSEEFNVDISSLK